MNQALWRIKDFLGMLIFFFVFIPHPEYKGEILSILDTKGKNS